MNQYELVARWIDEDLERREFEKSYGDNTGPLEKTTRGFYKSIHTNNAWVIWLARARLEYKVKKP